MKNKKLLLIIAIVLTVAVVGIVLTAVLKNDDINNTTNKEQQLPKEEIKVTGKLAKYIDSLTNNYYIKYSGKFKDDIGKPVNCIVEYTKDGDKFALRAVDINMHMICEGSTLYSISHNHKIIVEMSKQSFDIAEYNLVSNVDQTYIKSYKEKIKDIEYEVEEYSLNGHELKYYFEANELKQIKYNNEDIKILRLEKKTDSQLFVMPTGYTKVKA